MNLGQLTATIEKNKKPLAVAGAVGVAGLALMKRQQAGGDVGTGTTGKASTTAAGSLATPNGQVVYSSEASDVYNAIQPQLETIGTAINQLLNTKSTPDPTATIPVPAPPKPTTATSPTYESGFFRVAGSNLTYAQDAKGNLDWISKAEGDAFKIRAGQANAGQIKEVAKDSTFWSNRTYLGTGPVPTKL